MVFLGPGGLPEALKPMLTIVMYHYVRDLANSRYPAIKGLSLEKFDGQMEYLARHYTMVTAQDVARAAAGEGRLPRNACWLTFDDGFSDHYEYVLPRLTARGFKGSFFPVARSALEGRVLDVHKIHFVLASARDPGGVIADIRRLVAERASEIVLPTIESLYVASDAGVRLDPPEIIFIKRLLQRELPPDHRGPIVDALFAKYVSADEVAFGRELYMSLAQLRHMAAAGMDIGAHGDTHAWLNRLTSDEQEKEIGASCDFLSRVYGRPARQWTMCYPFGGYDADTLHILPRYGCALGLTTKTDLVRDLSHPLELERLDTIDLPMIGNAAASEWTRRAAAGTAAGAS